VLIGQRGARGATPEEFKKNEVPLGLAVAICAAKTPSREGVAQKHTQTPEVGDANTTQERPQGSTNPADIKITKAQGRQPKFFQELIRSTVFSMRTMN
jgi:hypothetical protein